MLLSFIWLLVTPLSVPATADDNEALMARIEGKLKMPDGAQGLAAYDRYYFRVDDGMVRGVLIRPAPPYIPANPGHHWVAVNQAPTMLDGGCSQVNMVYDVKADRISGVWCNGVA